MPYHQPVKAAGFASMHAMGIFVRLLVYVRWSIAHKVALVEYC